jgi:hypothetical protein
MKGMARGGLKVFRFLGRKKTAIPPLHDLISHSAFPSSVVELYIAMPLPLSTWETLSDAEVLPLYHLIRQWSIAEKSLIAERWRHKSLK